MFFSEIARRWAKLTAEPAETMMSALVAGWWRGQLPHPESREIRPTALEMLASLGEETKIQPFAEEQPDGGAVVNFWPKIILRAKPHELPAAELEEVYQVLAQVHWEDCPAGDARAGIACQQVSRTDFARWYAGTELWPKPDMNTFWPSIPAEDGRRTLGASGQHTAQAPLDVAPAAIRTGHKGRMGRKKSYPDAQGGIEGILRKLLDNRKYGPTWFASQSVGEIQKEIQKHLKSTLPGRTVFQEIVRKWLQVNSVKHRQRGRKLHG